MKSVCNCTNEIIIKNSRFICLIYNIDDVNLVNKYGVCPKNVFPETNTSSATRETGQLINFNIRKFAAIAKAIYKKDGLEAVKKEKENLLNKFYVLLTNAYGLAPEKFDFEYTDKDGNYHLEKGFTPLSFKEKYKTRASKTKIIIKFKKYLTYLFFTNSLYSR